MDVIVKAKNCAIPERLRQEATERVEHATRFFNRLGDVEMVFSEEQNPRIPTPAIVELTARPKGQQIRAQGTGADHRTAVDAAVARFERQLQRYKSRMVDRNRRGGRAQPSSNDLLAEAGQAEALDDEGPRIVRTKQFDLVPMLPEEAAIQLEFLDHDFYLFRHATTGECSLLYRRRDGDLGLIEALA